MKRYIRILLVATLMACLLSVAGQAQGNIVGNFGFSTAGLGSKAGPSTGFDLDYGSRWEILSRFNVSFADKTTGAGHSVSERLIVRYGSAWRVGGGVGLNYQTADFGSRSTASILGHVAYDYRQAEKYRVVPYVTARWSADNHATKGFEAGFELYETRGRLVFKQAAGVETLWFHDFGLTAIRRQAYGFVRGGVGVRF